MFITHGDGGYAVKIKKVFPNTKKISFKDKTNVKTSCFYSTVKNLDNKYYDFKHGEI